MSSDVVSGAFDPFFTIKPIVPLSGAIRSKVPRMPMLLITGHAEKAVLNVDDPSENMRVLTGSIHVRGARRVRWPRTRYSVPER